MTQSSTHPDATSECSSRERIDALLDEALTESFPASSSSAIGLSILAITQEDRGRNDDARSTP